MYLYFLLVRVYINIIYTIVETMRIKDPQDSEEILAAKETFRLELGESCARFVLLYFGSIFPVQSDFLDDRNTSVQRLCMKRLKILCSILLSLPGVINLR